MTVYRSWKIIMDLQLFGVLLLVAILVVCLCITVMQLIETAMTLTQFSTSKIKQGLKTFTTLCAQAWYQYGPTITSKLKRVILSLITKKGGR